MALRLLSPAQARKQLVTAQNDTPWNPDAVHPAVDKIMPRERDDISDYFGWALGHFPLRDFAAEISPPGAGKTMRRRSFQAALGSDYVTTTRAETFQRQRYNRGGTSHNGGVFALGSPAKLCFVPEFQGGTDLVLVNQLTGGEGELDGRECGMPGRKFWASGHIVIQANKAPDGVPLLGIAHDAGEGTASDAFAERLRMFDIPGRPESERDDTIPAALGTMAFREAMLVRLAYHAHRMSGYGNTAPESQTMKDRLAAQVESEQPDWFTECLQPAVRPLASGEVSGIGDKPLLDAYHARQLVVDWLKDNSSERPPSLKAVLGKLQRIVGKGNRRARVSRRNGAGGVVQTQVWDGWTLERED